jgi:general secretion pathway protein G
MKRIALIASLLAIGAVIPICFRFRSFNEARESVRREDTNVVNQAIHAYTIDTGKIPESLDDLVKAGYLKAIPGRPVPIEDDPILPNAGRV